MAIGDTELSATKQEVIAEIAQRALISNSAILSTVRDLSMFAVKGAETISFPASSSLFAAENRASGANATIQDIAFKKDSLALDQRMIIAWAVDSDDELESRLDVQRELIDRAAREHARDVDAKLIAEMESVGIATTTAGSISQAVVLEMRAILGRNKANMQNLYLAVSPEEEANLLQIDPFVGADKYGSAIIPQGVLGTIYGVNVVVSPELSGDQYFMYESDGIGIGFQRRPQFDEVNNPLLGPGAKTQVLGQKYGVKGLQIGAPGSFLADGTTPTTTESGLIVKDNN
jgi:hypothetical protein